MKRKSAIKSAFAIFFCVALFFGISYAYLHRNLVEDNTNADIKDYTVPYAKVPYNTGVLLNLPNNSAMLLYLDFTDTKITVVKIDNPDGEAVSYYGYSVDRKIYLDYQVIEGIIDRIGGINLEINGITMRYTGGLVVSEILSQNPDEDIKKQIISAIFETISKKHFSNEDFVYIIENSDTDLTVPDCFYWSEYFSDMCKNIWFVN